MLVGKEIAEDHNTDVEGKIQESEILLRCHDIEVGMVESDRYEQGIAGLEY